MYKTRREARYLARRKDGFLKFEARPLSRVNIKVCPYLDEMRRDRRGLILRARKQGQTLKQFEDSIRELYKVNKWVKRDKLGRVICDPWKMFRHYEDRYKDKNPQYTSPWVPRQKHYRDFQSRVERTILKQRGLA